MNLLQFAAKTARDTFAASPSLHTPAIPPAGENGRIGDGGHREPQSPHVSSYARDMGDLLLIAQLAPGLSPKQYETVILFARGGYYAAAKFWGQAVTTRWDRAATAVKEVHLMAAYESLRDMRNRCIYCGAPTDNLNDLYCSRSCAASADMDNRSGA